MTGKKALAEDSSVPWSLRHVHTATSSLWPLGMPAAGPADTRWLRLVAERAWAAVRYRVSGAFVVMWVWPRYFGGQGGGGSRQPVPGRPAERNRQFRLNCHGRNRWPTFSARLCLPNMRRIRGRHILTSDKPVGDVSRSRSPLPAMRSLLS